MTRKILERLQHEAKRNGQGRPGARGQNRQGRWGELDTGESHQVRGRQSQRQEIHERDLKREER